MMGVVLRQLVVTHSIIVLIVLTNKHIILPELIDFIGVVPTTSWFIGDFVLTHYGNFKDLLLGRSMKHPVPGVVNVLRYFELHFQPYLWEIIFPI